MHRPTSTPRASLYHHYRVHAPWLPSTSHTTHDARRHAVVIVGAGPAGLTAALGLARRGVACTVLESELQACEGSRAIVFTRRTMDILQQVGVAERVQALALPWRVGYSHYRGQRVYRMEAPHDESHDRFAPMNNLQQPLLQEMLVQACEAEPLIELRWGNRVIGVDSHASQASLEVDTPAGAYTLVSDWVVAADGARSGVRTLLGLKMEGTAYEGRFVIADIRVDLPLPTERLAFFDPAWNPGNTVLLHRQPHGMWRVDYQLPRDESADDALEPNAIKARIQSALDDVGHGDKSWELDWSSVYSARTLTLPDYTHQRVLFMGDAAHLLPIFGVRGANTAFQDAQSLAWHLAMVVKGLAPESLMHNYSKERVSAAREIIEEAGKSTRFMTPPSEGYTRLRHAVLSLSLTEDFVRPLYHWRTARPHAYRHSDLNARDDDNDRMGVGPSHGELPPNVRLSGGAAPKPFVAPWGMQASHLFDRVGMGFALLVAWHEAALPNDLVRVIEAQRQRGLALRVIVMGVASSSVEGADDVWPDDDHVLRTALGCLQHGSAILLRPDHHVCARWLDLQANRLERALAVALLQATSPLAGVSSHDTTRRVAGASMSARAPARPNHGADARSAASGLDVPGLETAYDALASAIDAVGVDKAPLMLVKLALLQAQAGADVSTFTRCLEAASKDL